MKRIKITGNEASDVIDKMFDELQQMYSKVYNLRFVKPTDAKVASSYFVENLSKFIRTCNMQSINISMGPCGNMSITAKFDSSSDLKTFESKSKSIFSDVQGSFDFVQTNFSGVNIFAYETENTSTQITPH